MNIDDVWIWPEAVVQAGVRNSQFAVSVGQINCSTRGNWPFVHSVEWSKKSIRLREIDRKPLWLGGTRTHLHAEQQSQAEENRRHCCPHRNDIYPVPYPEASFTKFLALCSSAL